MLRILALLRSLAKSRLVTTTMGPATEPIFPVIPQPMALVMDTLSGPLRMSPTPSGSKSCSKARSEPEKPFFHEDSFSKLLSGPLVILHFALYGAVPIYYLVCYSPFSNFEAGQLNQIIRWALLLLTQYLTAILVVSWLGQYKVRKEVLGFACMVTAVTLLAGLKHWVEDIGTPDALWIRPA